MDCPAPRVEGTGSVARKGYHLEHHGTAQDRLAPLSDDALLVEIAAGNRRAFQCLMERHGKAMLALSQRIVGSPQEADDVVQEAFLKAWTKAAQWQVDGAARFSTWLYRVVLNASLDRRRRPAMAGLDDADEVTDPAPGSLDAVLAGQRQTLVARALATLPPRQQEALSLHYFSDISGPEAARVLELSVSAVEALLARGKKGLRKALTEMGITGLGDVL